MEKLKADVSKFLLLSYDKPLKIQNPELHAFKGDLDSQSFLHLLQKDEMDRFMICVNSTDCDNTLVSRNCNLAEDDVQILEHLSKWRNALESLFNEDYKHRIPFDDLEDILPLPKLLLSFNLAHILKFDPLVRFKIVPSGNISYVMLHLSPIDLELIEEWKDIIYERLIHYSHLMPILIDDVGKLACRPVNLSKTVKLLETLRNDTSSRFELSGEGMVTKVKAIIDPKHFEERIEEWRIKAIKALHMESRPMELSALGMVHLSAMNIIIMERPC
jgi:hypothetical protein